MKPQTDKPDQGAVFVRIDNLMQAVQKEIEYCLRAVREARDRVQALAVGRDW